VEFDAFTHLATFFSRKFSKELMSLLVQYNDISASEAASRLGLHIKTVQDWLEGLSALGLLNQRTVAEGKRPFNRYSLTQNRCSISIDFGQLALPADDQNMCIREKKNADAQFTTASRGKAISSISIISGKGRSKDVRKLNVNPRQGSFLYFLPFPTAKPKSISEIMDQAGLGHEFLGEIFDLVNLLLKFKIVERA